MSIGLVNKFAQKIGFYLSQFPWEEGLIVPVGDYGFKILIILKLVFMDASAHTFFSVSSNGSRFFQVGMASSLEKLTFLEISRSLLINKLHILTLILLCFCHYHN